MKKHKCGKYCIHLTPVQQGGTVGSGLYEEYSETAVWGCGIHEGRYNLDEYIFHSECEDCSDYKEIKFSQRKKRRHNIKSLSGCWGFRPCKKCGWGTIKHCNICFEDICFRCEGTKKEHTIFMGRKETNYVHKKCLSKTITA